MLTDSGQSPPAGRRGAGGAAVLAFAIILSTGALAGDLKGKVVGKDGNPKANLRVDINGPDKLVTVTDSKGRFKISNAAGGIYRVRITERQRKVEQRVEIPKSGSKSVTINLDW